MKQELFNLKTIHLLGDGTLNQDFETTLASVVKDCTSRPAIDKPREVKIVVTVRPKPNQDGTCDDVVVHVQVASKAPAKQIQPYTMRATANGGLRYQPADPSNPDQTGIFE